MSDFTIHTAESAPEGSKEALGRLEQNIGFVPNLAATIGESPTALQGFVALQSALRGGSALTAVEREIVGLTVSYTNNSRYSMAAHSTFASGAGAESEVVTALRSGADLPVPRLEALHAFTRRLLDSRGHLPENELAAFLAAGYSHEHALEVIAQLSYTTFANFAANLADTPVDSAFEPNRWAAAA
jgi:alkylhydroperoxidase family enzyme